MTGKENRLKNITFIDLFAGIGGTRLGFELAGATCVFSSEWNKFARETYNTNFGEIPSGDITEIEPESIPDHNILVAGFPCQPFSISGVVKKNSLNRPHGFADITQGTMFFRIYDILKEKQPDAFLLENVPNLISHDRGKTFEIIIQALQDDLKYNVNYKIISSDGVVPQKRRRIYIIGFKEDKEYSFPEISGEHPKLKSILELDVSDKYTLSEKLWIYLQEYSKKQRKKGNGFGYSLADLNGPSRTLSARYYKDGSEILIPQKAGRPRRLTPRECARLMGFPDSFIIPVSDAQAYRQFGNSVIVPIIKELAQSILEVL